jgi:dihydropteroate synthase
MSVWRTTRFGIALDRPRVMGIVNVTPDSFSDGGAHADTPAAIAHAQALLRDGADILDIGGESTRPGATPVSLQQELARVMPVVREAVNWGVPVSVDTSRAEVIQACLDAGIDIVNDIRALRLPGAQAVVAGHPDCGVCLMHMRGEPQHMQAVQHGQDDDAVMAEVSGFLAERCRGLIAAGVRADRVVVDPGIGFGKSIAENLALLRRQRELLGLGFPILAGWSRKSTLGAVTGAPVERRQAASVSAALLAALNGARVLRVHDVRETVDALKVWQAAGMFDTPPPGSGGTAT